MKQKTATLAILELAARRSVVKLQPRSCAPLGNNRSPSAALHVSQRRRLQTTATATANPVR